MNTIGSTSQPTGTPTSDTPAQDAMQSELESPSPAENSPRQNSKRFPVIEIFGPVIQGEGSQAGQQTMFIRFGGCDYRCKKCDSLHAVEPAAVQKHATYMTAEEIVERLYDAREFTGAQWVTFSGGNPCMHKLDTLVDDLLKEGWYINVETQGTLWQDWVNKCTMVTISPKSMGMGEKFEEDKFTHFFSHIYVEKPVCIKIVVFSAQDLEFALHVQSIVDRLSGGPTPAVAFYLSLGNPCPPILDMDNNLQDHPFLQGIKWDSISGLTLPTILLKGYRDLCEEILPDPRLKRFRFLPQLHVLVYGNEVGR